MWNKCYLLSVREFCEEKTGKELLRTAFHKVDETRRKKSEQIRHGATQAASLGAGLLLQLAVQEALGRKISGKKIDDGESEKRETESDGKESGSGEYYTGEKLTIYTVSQVLRLLAEPLDLQFDYGARGKPYLRDYPFYFNLSHSGEYVFCVISDQEVGVDIQQCGPVDGGRIAGRFFTEIERQALADCTDFMERRKLFYQMWVRKEAYGKLTGEGIAATLGESMLPGRKRTSDIEGAQQVTEKDFPMTEVGDNSSICWREWSLQDYAIVLCSYKE